MTLPVNKLANVRRRVDRARDFPRNTCGASRHVQQMMRSAEAAKWWFANEPEHAIGSVLSVLESLWKLRTKARKAGIYP